MQSNYSYIAEAISIEADNLLKKDPHFETRPRALYSVMMEVDLLIGELMLADNLKRKKIINNYGGYIKNET